MISVGLNLSSNKVYIALLSGNRKGVVVKKLIMEELPESPIAKGEISDILTVAENLKTIWRKHRLPGKKLHLGISNQKTIVKEVEIPVTDDEEVKNSLNYQISEYIPIKKDNLIYDYFTIDKTKTSSKLLIVGAMRSMIDSFVEILKYSGLIAQSIDLNSFAIYRTYEYIDSRKIKGSKKGEQSRLALDIGESISNIGVLHKDSIKFPRVTTVSIERFIEGLSPIIEKDHAFCRKLIDKYDFNANLQETETKKKTKKDEKPAPQASQKNITEMGAGELVKDGKIIDIFKKNAEDLLTEISISIEHFNHDAPGNKIKEISLSGQNISNIDKYIEKRTGLKTSWLKLGDLIPEKEMKTKKQKLGGIEENLDAAAFGMALRGMNK